MGFSCWEGGGGWPSWSGTVVGGDKEAGSTRILRGGLEQGKGKGVRGGEQVRVQWKRKWVVAWVREWGDHI